MTKIKYKEHILITGITLTIRKVEIQQKCCQFQLKSRSIEFDNIDQELSEQPDNSNKEINTINQNNYNELPVNNSIDDMIEKQAEVNDLIKSISWLSVDEN